MVHDVTERQRAEAKLRESEDRYRDLVEHSEDWIVTHDLEGHMLSANPAVARMLGCEVGELLGTPMRDNVPPPSSATSSTSTWPSSGKTEQLKALAL
jgi:PAS domain-containing protein